MIAAIVDWILSLHGVVAVVVVFLVPAVEASAFVGFVFPGEIAVLLGGVLAYQGRIPLWAAIVAAVTGAIIGDSIGYWIGRKYGRRLLTSIGRRLPFVGARIDHHLEGAEAYVRRRGASAVFFGRFTAALRVMVPGLAGMAQIPYGEFALFNALGGVLWGTGFVVLGFVAGAAWERVAGIASRVGLAVLALVVVILIGGRVLKVWRRAEQAERGPLARARRRWPRQTRWLERRFDPVSPQGFALSAAVGGAVAGGWLFAAMTQDVIAKEESVRLDPRVLRFAVEHRTAGLTTFMKTITVFGSNWVVVTLALVVGLLIFARRGTWRPLVQLGLTVGGGILLYEGFTQWVGRARPPAEVRLVPVSGFAFPSGHATQAAAVFAMITVVLTARTSARYRVLGGVVAGLLILAVGVSRIYLGVHWFTDVVGGWALGGLWACVVIALNLATDGAIGRRAAPAHATTIARTPAP